MADTAEKIPLAAEILLSNPLFKGMKGVDFAIAEKLSPRPVERSLLPTLFPLEQRRELQRQYLAQLYVGLWRKVLSKKYDPEALAQQGVETFIALTHPKVTLGTLSPVLKTIRRQYELLEIFRNPDIGLEIPLTTEWDTRVTYIMHGVNGTLRRLIPRYNPRQEKAHREAEEALTDELILKYEPTMT